MSDSSTPEQLVSFDEVTTWATPMVRNPITRVSVFVFVFAFVFVFVWGNHLGDAHGEESHEDEGFVIVFVLVFVFVIVFAWGTHLGDAHGEESHEDEGCPHVAKLRPPLLRAANSRPTLITNQPKVDAEPKKGDGPAAIMAIMLLPRRQLPAELVTRWWRIGWLRDWILSIHLCHQTSVVNAGHDDRRAPRCNSRASGSLILCFYLQGGSLADQTFLFEGNQSQPTFVVEGSRQNKVDGTSVWYIWYESKSGYKYHIFQNMIEKSQNQLE